MALSPENHLIILIDYPNAVKFWNKEALWEIDIIFYKIFVLSCSKTP